MLNERLEHLTDYPFDRLRSLLDPLDPPSGLEPLALSIGEPKGETPALLTEVLTANGADWNRYPPIDGTPDLREAIGDWLVGRYDLPELDPHLCVMPVAGTREALFLAGILSVPEKIKDSKPYVLIPNPFYQVYLGAAVFSGAEPYYLPATRETGFQPDLAAVDPEILEKTALVILCSPANPQGSVAGPERLREAIALARRYGFTLIFDECYSEIYGQTPPPGGLRAAADLDDGLDNVLVFNSLSKRSGAPGLRSGFAAGDAALISKFRRLRAYSAATVPLPIMAASAALWRDEAHVEINRNHYRGLFDAADSIIGSDFGYRRPGGGFFLWLDVADGEAAARKLWQEAALRVIPGAYLARTGADGVNPGQAYIRVALVHDRATVETALNRLVGVLR